MWPLSTLATATRLFPPGWRVPAIPPSAHMGGIAQSATVAFRTGLLAATRDKFEKHNFVAFGYTKPAAPLHIARPLGIDGDKAGLTINPRSPRC